MQEEVPQDINGIIGLRIRWSDYVENLIKGALTRFTLLNSTFLHMCKCRRPNDIRSTLFYSLHTTTQKHTRSSIIVDFFVAPFITIEQMVQKFCDKTIV